MLPLRALRSCVAGLLLAVLGLTFLSGSTWAAETLVKITLLQLNDVYQAEPMDKGAWGGLGRVLTLRKAIQTQSPHTLMILAGDTLSPSVASNVFKGQQMIAAWNALSLDMAALGNHEFDFGDDVLKERMGESRFLWLAANVKDRTTGRPFADMPQYVLREICGIKVGFFGLLTPDTLKTSAPSADVEILDPIETARHLIPRIRAEGATVVVAITHLSIEEDKALARKVPLELIMGGHEHVVIQSFAGGTPIFKVGSDARNLGRIDLNVDAETGELESIDWELIPVTDSIPEDPTLLQAIAPYTEAMSQELLKPVGNTQVALDAIQQHNRSGETNLGNFIADQFRAVTGAEVALVNGGSVRSNTTYGPGPLTRQDVLAISPFENPVVKVRVDGKTLKQALEHGFSQSHELESGQFPQVSGLRVVYDPTRPVGQRVVSAKVNGSFLNPCQSYTVAITTYVLGGGDGYAMFKDAEVLSDLESAPLAPNVLLRAVSAQPSIAPQVEGRLQRVP